MPDSPTRQDPPGLGDLRDALGGVVHARPVVRMHRTQHLAIATLHLLGRWRGAGHERTGAGAHETQAVEGPRCGILEGGAAQHRPGPHTAQRGDEIGTDGTHPVHRPTQRGHDRAALGGVEPTGGVDGTEHLLLGGSLGIELEGQHLPLAHQAVRGGRQTDGVHLQAVAEPGLGDAPAILELTGEMAQIGEHLGIDRAHMMGHDAAEQDPTEARGGITGQVALAERHAPGRRMGPGAVDLEFGQHHHRAEGSSAPAMTVSRRRRNPGTSGGSQPPNYRVAMPNPPLDRNLALDLVRVTEAAAMAASRWMGRGDKEGADGAAVDAMRLALGTVPMDGVVIIGEGEKDEAPMLYNGERIGDGTPPQVDIAVDPIDGTTLTSKGRGNALAVIALSEKGTMFDPGPCVYMEKIAVGPELVGLCDISASPTDNLKAVARAKGIDITDVTAVILERDRHDDLIGEVRQAGARIRLIADGDVAGAISTAWPDSGADILFGIGGTPEGVIAAAALKSMGGELIGRLWPRNEEERAAALALGYDLDKVLGTDDLVAGDNCFFAATGITDGELVKGVHFGRDFVTTQSLVMRSRSGTVRLMNARHRADKVAENI